MRGAKKALSRTASLLPPLTALCLIVSMLSVSGALELMCSILSPAAQLLGIPREVIPLCIISPLSGSGSIAVLQDIFENTTADLEAFLKTIDSVKNNLAGIDVCDDQRDVPAWERVAAAGVGALTISYGSAIQGGQDGFKGLLQSILPQLGVALGMFALGITNPWLFIPALIATGGISAYFSNTRLERIVREKLGEKIKDSILESMEKNTDTAIEKLSKTLDNIAERVNSGMEKEIYGIQQSVDNVLKIRKEGENTAKQREALLLEQRKKAIALIDRLEDLLEQI